MSSELEQLAEIFRDVIVEYPAILNKFILEMLHDFPAPAQIKYRGKIVRHDDREWDLFPRPGKLLPTIDNIRLVLDRYETLTSYDVEIIVKYQVSITDFIEIIVNKYSEDSKPTVSMLTMLLRNAIKKLLAYYFFAENKRADVTRDEAKLKWIAKGLRHEREKQKSTSPEESTTSATTAHVQRALRALPSKEKPLPDILSWKYLKLDDFYRIQDEKQRKLIIQEFDKIDTAHAKLTGFDRMGFLNEREYLLSKDHPGINEELTNGIALTPSEQEILDKINAELETKYHDVDKGKINKSIDKKAEKFALNMLKRLSQYSVRTVPRVSARGGGTSSRTG